MKTPDHETLEVDGVAWPGRPYLSVNLNIKGEQIMGNRDTRGREKKKPKKKDIKPQSAPYRPAPTYKPAAPVAPQPPPNSGPGEGS
jgi:hypothetical protein